MASFLHPPFEHERGIFCRVMKALNYFLQCLDALTNLAFCFLGRPARTSCSHRSRKGGTIFPSATGPPSRTRPRTSSRTCSSRMPASATRPRRSWPTPGWPTEGPPPPCTHPQSSAVTTVPGTLLPLRRVPTLSSGWCNTSWLGAWSFVAARLARRRRPTRLLRPADSDSRPRESPSSPNAVAPDAPSACAALSNPSPSLADFFFLFFFLLFYFSPSSLSFSTSSFGQPDAVLQTFSLSSSLTP